MAAVIAMTSLVFTFIGPCGVFAGYYTRKFGCEAPRFLPFGYAQVEFGGIQVRYRCNRGYQLAGVSVSLCAGQDWADPVPVCVASGCSDIRSINHGKVAYSHSGGLVKITCDEDFVPDGPGVLACDGRRWNGTVPQCLLNPTLSEKEIQDRENRIHNAKYSGKKYPWRSRDEWLLRADYSCLKGGKKLPPPPGVNTLPYVRWMVFGGKPRLYTQYRCKWGFVLAGENKYMYCKAGTWVGNLPKCVTAVPPRKGGSDWLSLPRDDTAPGLGLSHQESLVLADYSCMGHVGDPQKIPPPEIAHAVSEVKNVVKDGMPHMYVQYSCEAGYKIQSGDGYMYCNRGAWSGTRPKCVPNPKGYGLGDANPCQVKNGGCDHVCVWAYNMRDARCACRTGFQLAQDRKHCEDMDECENHNGGCGQHKCINTQGSFRCQCLVGYVQARNGRSCIRPNGLWQQEKTYINFKRAG